MSWPHRVYLCDFEGIHIKGSQIYYRLTFEYWYEVLKTSEMYKNRIERVQNIQLQNVVENVDNILENERSADKVIARTKSEILSLLSTLEERTTSVPLQTGDLADEPFDLGATERSPDSQPISRKRRAAWGQTGPVELAVQEGKQLCLAPSSSRTAQSPPTSSSPVNSTPTHPSPTQPGDECHLSETVWSTLQVQPHLHSDMSSKHQYRNQYTMFKFARRPAVCNASSLQAECLEDLSCDLLSSESAFLPVSTPLRALHPHVPQTQSPTPSPLETNQKEEKPTRFSEDAHPVKFDNKLNPISASKKTGDLSARAQTKIFYKEDGRQVLGSKLAQKYSAKIPATSSRYESYEKRPIRPLNQGHVNSRIKSYPHRPGTVQMQTKGESKPGYKSKDKEIMTSNAVRSIALSRIKDVAESRKRLSQQTQSNKKLNVAIDNRTESRCHTAPESRRTNVSPSPLLSKGENLIKGGAVQEAWVDNSVRDSGFLSRPCSDAIPIAEGNNNNIETTAATRIQCLWRGYWARQRTPAVKWVREELRRRRMEEHILFLRAELDRHKLLYHDERQLRNLQLEAIKHLWKEIQSLQSWKNSILSDQASVTQQKHQNRDIENTMEKIEVIRGQRHQGEELSPPESQAQTATQSELEYTCVHLQLQVRQLEEKLESLSAVVSSNQQLSDTLLSTQPDVKEGCVQVSAWSGDVSEASLCGTENRHARWSQMTSTDETDPPRELEPGCPAQPTLLQLHHRGDNSVVVLWQTPHRITGTLLGYRVYVNQEAVGMVAGHQTAALMEGLDPKQIYRFQVKAVSSLGESRPSHTVVAVFKSQLDIATIHQQSSSGNITDDDSDDGSVTGHKSGTNQPAQRIKKKSPRREKDLKHGGTCKTNLNQEGASEESLASRKDSSSADELTIFRYPRLHTPKRSSRIKSPDATLSELSCANDTLSSEVDTLVTSRPPTSGYSPKLGETKAKTGALGVQNKAAKSPLSSDSSPKHQSEDQNDAPKRSRSRSGDSPATSSGIPPDPRVCWEEEVSHSRPPLSPNSHRPNKEDNIPLSPKRSNVSSADRVVNTNPVPTLSKRKPVGNTKAVDGADKELNKPLCDRRRTSVSDLLEQRLANKQNSSASDGGAFVKPAAPVSGCATFPSRSRNLEVIKSFSDDDVRKSKSENSSPTEKGQDVLAAGSESDSTVPFSIKSRTQGTFVSNLLQKLQTFSKAQEQIRDSKKSLKLRAKSSSDTALVGGEGDREEAWAGRIRRVSGGEDSEEEGRGVMSDSGPATPSSHQAKLNKGHRRSSSMHGAGPFVVREVAGIEGARSPIIMDGGKKKVSPSAGSGSGVRRHASFNGILPSRGQDIRPASEETLGGKIKSAPKPAPVESSGQPTFRSRSPSPNTSARSGVHQPVLSAAQLQRLKSPAGIGQ